MKLDILKNYSGKIFVNGEFIETKDSDYIEIYNPVSLEKIGFIPNIDDFYLEKAICSSENAQKKWSSVNNKERSNILKKWFLLIIENLDNLAKILVLEQGKSYEDAKREIIYGANFIEWFSNIILTLSGKIIEGVKDSQDIFTLYEPIGVVAAITPWNFPSAMVARKIAPAIATGCSIILKPSEFTPFSSFAMVDLAYKAGVPDGVINIVTGDANFISDILCSDKRIKKISFTGSTRVGKILYSKSANTIKKLSLELGGNAPFIVFEDADLEIAVNALISGKLRSSGQACTSPNRIFLHEKIYDEFLKKLVPIFLNLNVGNGLNKNVSVGPLINKNAQLRIKSLIDDAVSKGANIEAGGKIPKKFLDENNNLVDVSEKHSFFEPTILTNCNENMNLFKEEIFGPVIACYIFNNENQVIKMANNTDYGLASYIFTKDISRIYRVTKLLDYGMVGVNEGIISNEKGAFGGRKFSGFGVEGSDLGIYEYLVTKYICMNHS